MPVGFQRPSFGGLPGGSRFGSAYSGQPGQTIGPQPPTKTYRPDTGEYMTDLEYSKSQEDIPIRQMQRQTDIQTGAQRGLAAQAGDIASAARTQQEALGEKQQGAEAELQAGAEQRRMNMFAPYLNKLTSGFAAFGGGGGALPYAQLGGVGGEDAARQAAFARAKDVAGSTGRAALNALMDVQGARGIVGSGLGLNEAGGVIGEGARQLGEVGREQLIQDLANARQRAAEAYQGSIAQRGQDVTLRGQNLQALMGLVGSFPGQITARY